MREAGFYLAAQLVVATAGLVWVIGALTRTGLGRLGLELVPAYFFTATTSFANPAVTRDACSPSRTPASRRPHRAPSPVTPEALDLPEPVHEP